jgi:hypothetical protein
MDVNGTLRVALRSTLLTLHQVSTNVFVCKPQNAPDFCI